MNDCNKDKSNYVTYIHNVDLVNCEDCRTNRLSENIGCEMNCVTEVPKTNLCDSKDGSLCDTFLWDAKNKTCIVPTKKTEKYFTKYMGKSTNVYPMYVIKDTNNKNKIDKEVKNNNKVLSLLESQRNNLNERITKLNDQTKALRTGKNITVVQEERENKEEIEANKIKLENTQKEKEIIKQKRDFYDELVKNNLKILLDKRKLNKRYNRLNIEKSKELGNIDKKLKTLTVKGSRNYDLFKLNNKFINYLVVGLGITVVFSIIVFLILKLRG